MSDIINNASTKIAGKKHGSNNEVKEQVTKAKHGGNVKSTHEIVNKILAGKKPKANL